MLKDRWKIGLSGLLFFGFLLSLSAAPATILLVPIDDRPATTQFAVMIGAVAGRQVEMPPLASLGHFTTPGSMRDIAGWLAAQQKPEMEALVLSVDMLAYGGLIASRRHGVSLDEALKNMGVLRDFRKTHPRLPIYAFHTVMRLAPTATAQSMAYHDALARWASIVDEAEQKKDPRLATEAAALKKSIPEAAFEDYLKTRERNHQLNFRMIQWVQEGLMDFLILSQDDAKVFGLHRAEQRRLESEIRRLKLEKRVLLYAGADEVSNVLVSRAVLAKVGLQPQARIVYSSEAGRKAVDPYEDRSLEESVALQLAGAGAREPVSGPPDYTLFLHVPRTTPEEKRRFMDILAGALRSGQPVAYADVVWEPVHGGPDPEIIDHLAAQKCAHLMRAFASWNTAGNTLGTVIPHANMDAVLRTILAGNAALAEAGLKANLEFLIHRYINDWGYHDKVRPKAQAFVRDDLKAKAIELFGEDYRRTEELVRREMTTVVRDFFAANFRDRRFRLPGQAGRELVIRSLENLEVLLPWPRTFEVAVRFRLGTETIPAPPKPSSTRHGKGGDSQATSRPAAMIRTPC